MAVTKTKNIDAKTSAKIMLLKEKRDKFLEGQEQECRDHIQKINDIFARDDKSNLEKKYELGCAIRDLRDDLSNGNETSYGQNRVGKVCDMFGWERGLVYGTLAVVEAFPQEVITTLCNRPFPNGRLITFGHLRVLARVKRQATRGGLLEKTIANGWTRAELEAEILKRSEDKGKDGRGRSLKQPKDLPDLIRQQEQTARPFIARAKEVWDKPEASIRELVGKLPAAQVTEDQLKKLKDHASILRELIEKAKKELDETDRAIEDLQKKIETIQSPEPVGEMDAAKPQPSIEEKETVKPQLSAGENETANEPRSSLEDKQAAKPQPSAEEKKAAKSQPSIEDKDETIEHQPSIEDKEAAKLKPGHITAKKVAKPK